MNRNSALRLAAVLLSTVLLASPALAAKTTARPGHGRGFVATLWQLVEPFVPAIAKARGTMDPNGFSTPTQPTVVQPIVGDTADARGTMDPNGASAN